MTQIFARMRMTSKEELDQDLAAQAVSDQIVARSARSFSPANSTIPLSTRSMRNTGNSQLGSENRRRRTAYVTSYGSSSRR